MKERLLVSFAASTATLGFLIGKPEGVFSIGKYQFGWCYEDQRITSWYFEKRINL